MDSIFFKKWGQFLSLSILLLTFLNSQFAFAVNNALSFNTNQRVNCGTSSTLKPTSAFTVEAWVKPTTNSQGGYGGAGIIASDSNPDANNNVGTYFSVRAGLYGAVNTPAGRKEITGNSIPLVWQHVAMVFDGTSLKLYQDGVMTASTTFAATTISPSSAPFVIAGSGNNDFWYNFQGQIDEVRVWNMARTQTQIRQAMNTSFTGSEMGLVAYYNFDQTSGTALPDLAGGNNNGTLTNMTGSEWTTSGALISPPGNALSFDGNTNVTLLPSYSNINFSGSSDFTISMWFKGNGALYNQDSGSNGMLELILIALPNGNIGFYTASNNGGWDPGGFDSNQTVNTSVWNHVALTKSGNAVSLYINGQLDKQSTLSLSATLNAGAATGNLYIGYSTDNYGFFTGQIDEVQIWNMALSQPDIQSYMYTAPIGTENNLVAYYRLDQTAGNTVVDITSNSYDGTVNGTATWGSSGAMVPFPISASNVTATDFTANWNAVNGATGYQIDVSTDPNFGSFLLQNVAAGSGTSFTVTGLTLTTGTSYYFRMRAEKSGWISPNSASISFLLSPGNALSFNGTGNFVNTTTQFTDPQLFTLEAWFNTTTTQGGGIIGFSNTNASTPCTSACDRFVWMSNNGKINFGFWLSGAKYITSPKSYNDGNWHHAAASLSSAGMMLYVDGVLVASDAATTAAPSYNGYWNIGWGNGWGTASSLYFSGKIDEVRIWSVARSQTQIQSNMYHALVGNETDLVTYYNFDQATGSSLPDLAGGDNKGLLMGAPTTWTAATWKYGYPYVTTGAAPLPASVRATTAPVAGTLVDPGVAAVTASGICYATTANPTTPCSTDGATTAAAFTSNLTGLTPGGRTYYARAYATNAFGTNYGTGFSPDVTFTTHYLPVIAQTSPLSVTMSQEGSPVAWTSPTITATDTDGDTLTWSVNTQATHGTATVSGTGASPTTFTYSPNTGFTGSDSFIVQVADVDGIATITVNVAIGAAFPMVTSTPLFDQTIKFDTLVGKTQVQTVTFKNTGDRALFFNSINTPIAPFSYPKPMPFTFIPWGGVPLTTQTLELSCTPTVAGLQTMTVQIATNDPYNPTLNYPLECMGRQPVAVSSVANNTPLNFGTALINSTLTQTISFSENGNSDLILNSATITGANAADFKITSPPAFPITIADGTTTSQAVTVSCTPTTAIALTATLQITTNDPANATLTYPLQCSGQYSLTLSTSGQGTIAGCGSSCTQNYSQDAVVTVSATPATGWQFSSWGGDCANGQVTMTAHKSCTANFTQIVTNTTNPGTTTPGGTTTTPGNTTGTPTNTIPGTGTTGTTTPPLPPTGTTTGSTPPPTTGTGTTPTSTTPTGGNTTTAPSDVTVSVQATVPISNATVDAAMSNYYQTATNLTVLPNGSISGGTLAGTVTNQGLIANITVAENSTVTGGKLSGFNTNSGLLNDVTISQYSQVQGGNYAGSILNNGTLNSPILSSSSSVINYGVIENPVILPGANISGGTLVGTIIVLGTFDSVSIPPTATVITQVSEIPTVIFKQVTAQTLALLPPSVISQISPAQFAEIPVSSLSGLTAQNMTAISPQVVQSLDAKHIAALNPEEFKTMPGDGVAKFLTNFDTAAITPQEAEKLLPPQWTIDAAGNLTAPPGTAIAFKTLDQRNLPKGLRLPNLTDLNSSFALGGKGSNPLLNQLNQGLVKEGGAVTQQKSGVVKTEVAGAVGYGRKSQFAFMIDPEHIFILDENALRGLQINEQGQYIIVTEDGKQIPITPMTKDPEALLAVLGDNAEIDIQKTGEVFIKHPPISRMRDSGIVHSVGIFDPFIEPAPEDICQEDTTGEMQCDWSKADAAQQPGLRTARNLRVQSAAKVTYPDGTSQKIYPAVLFPDILVAEAQKMAGVEKAIFRMDGIIAVTYQGVKLWLIPEFDVQVQPIPAGTKIPPSLTLTNGALIYRVPYGDNLVTSQLSIIEAPILR